MYRFFWALALIASCIPRAAFCFTLPPSFEVTNNSIEPYTGIVAVTVPFPQGEVTDVSQLNGIRADGNITDVKPLAFHRTPQGVSIAAVQLMTRLSLAANQTRTVLLTQGAPANGSFATGPEMQQVTDILSRIGIGATLAGGSECLAPLMGSAYEVRHAGKVALEVQYRVRPRCSNGTTLPLTANVYLRLGSNSDHARFTVLLANDTLERPVSGGLAANVKLYVRTPLRAYFHQPQAFGGIPYLGMVADYATYQLLTPAEPIADGARVPFSFQVVVGTESSPQARSARAAAANPSNQLLGMVPFEYLQTSAVLGTTGGIPLPRFLDRITARNSLQSLCSQSVSSSATGFKGTILQHPFITGDQGDFGATALVFAQQTAHTASTCPLQSPYVGVLAEWLRPTASGYWQTINGTERPVTVLDRTDLMLWGDNVHQPNFYNGTQFDPYRARMAPFQSGPTAFSRWDEEHLSDNALSAVALLVGTEEIRDIAKQHIRMIFWNHYNWYRLSMMVAPRAIGRAGQALLLLSSFFQDQETDFVLGRFVHKMSNVVLPFMQSEQNAVGFVHAGAGPVNAVGIYTECLSGLYPQVGTPNEQNCRTVYAWQLGFLIQSAAALHTTGVSPATEQILSLFLSHYDYYFNSLGDPVRLFLRSAQSVQSYGGIGAEWHAGWVQAAAALPNHPRSAEVLTNFALGVLQPRIESSPPVQQFWRTLDRWNMENLLLGQDGGASLTGESSEKNVTKKSLKRLKKNKKKRGKKGKNKRKNRRS